MDIQAKIKELPQSPGVYVFKDSGGKILYIGKAANLKKRIQSYFTRQLAARTQAMVSQISGIEYILSPNESQALIKEAALIKAEKPRYNVALRDDKSYPLIRISAENFPTVSLCRRKKRATADKALYFGPYPNAKLLREALKIIRSIFGFRSCRTMPKKACLFFRLKLCPAPCIGKVSEAEYAEIVNNIKLFLQGRQGTLIEKLSQKMVYLAKAHHFEEAASVRDQVRSLSLFKKEKGPADFHSEARELRKRLGLPFIPERIEAFDISNIHGKEATGSMVSFFKGSPDKQNYRRFKIRGVAGIDDYAMLAEVVGRRYARLKKEGRKYPDLILIDGGRSHLLTAEKELKKLRLDIPVISVAKEKENIYTLKNREPVNLPFDSAALHLIQRIRDEAHRFAVSYHHLLRRKKVISR